MKILGIDYGRSKVGLAIAEGPLADPWKVLHYSETSVLESQIKKIIETEKIEKIVVGLSEGQMAEETKEFVAAIQPFIISPIELFDETLSSHDAQEMSRAAGISQKKRHEMEDAYAAAIMLQNYLDSTL